MEPIADGSALRSRESTLDRPSKIYRNISQPKQVRRRALSRSLLAFLALGVLWRVVRYATVSPLWGDEAFLAVSVLVRDYAGLLRPLEYFQIAPAGFLWAELAVVRWLGPSERALRLIPFLSGLASLGLFARFAGRTVDRRSAVLAVGIFAASYYPVRHAAEVKPYATDLFFSMLTIACAWATWLDRDSPRRWLALSGLVAAGVWFSYPLIFVATGVGSVLGFGVATRPTRRSLAFLVAFGFATSASFLASYLLVAGPQSQAAPFYASLKTWQGAFPPLSRPWQLPYWLLDVHTGNMLAYPYGGNNFGSVVSALLVVAGGLTLSKRRPALLALLLSPLVPTFLASVLQKYPYGTSARITLYMAPSFCLLAGIGAASIIRRLSSGARRRADRLSTIGLVATMLIPIVANFLYPYKNWEDTENRRAVVDLARLARPGDRWVIYDGVENLPKSEGLMLEHWLQQMAEVRYNLLAKAPVPMTWWPDPATINPQPTGRTWLIVHRSGCPAFDENGLGRLRQDLEARLGTPRFRVDRLTRRESIEAFEYPAPNSPTP